MFPKVKKVSEKKTLVELLTFIVAGTLSAAGCAIVPQNLAKEIHKQEPTFLKINTEADPAGNVSVSATSEAIAALGGTAPAAAEAVAASKPSFVLESGFTPPESKRGGIKSDIYPFAQMEVGQSFFVAATEARPNPAKVMASTVSGAIKRYATHYPAKHAKAGQPTGKDGRKFTVRARVAGQDGEKANGARVYRIA